MGNTFLIVDADKTRVNNLIMMIRQIEKDCSFLTFSNAMEYQAGLKETNNLISITGAFVRFDGNLKQTSFIIDNIYEVNPKVYVLVSADSMDIELLKNLIQCRVGQVLIPPFDVNSLKGKMQFAADFQAKIVAENKTMPAYRSFRFWHEVTSEGYQIAYIVGWLADRCELPKITPNKKGATLFIDFDLMDGISSVGVRSWMLWIKELHANGFANFVCKNIRHFFITQINAITGFLPSNGHVDSFYLRYFNDSLDQELEVNFRRGQDFDDREMVIPLFVKSADTKESPVFILEDQVEKLSEFYKGKVKTSDKVVIYLSKKIQLVGD